MGGYYYLFCFVVLNILCMKLEFDRSNLANCPAVLLSHFPLWISYETQLTNAKIKMSKTSRPCQAINWV